MRYNRSELKNRCIQQINEKNSEESNEFVEARTFYTYYDVKDKKINNLLFYKIEKVILNKKNSSNIVAVKDIIKYKYRIKNYKIEYTKFKRIIELYKV